MREIVLSGAHWKVPDDFYNALLPALGAPDWHGHNLDALWDSITAGAINRIDPPFRVRLTEADLIEPACRAVVDGFVALIEEAKAEGFAVEALCE